MSVTNPIKTQNYTTEIFSDASRSGWGVCCEGERSYGHWDDKNRKHHINYLELLSAFFGLKCFAKDLRDCNVLLRIDNTTAIAYINRMGGTRYKNLSNSLRIFGIDANREIWEFLLLISVRKKTR